LKTFGVNTKKTVILRWQAAQRLVSALAQH